MAAAVLVLLVVVGGSFLLIGLIQGDSTSVNPGGVNTGVSLAHGHRAGPAGAA